MSHKYQQTWDLDPLFAGGSASPALQEHLAALEREIDPLRSVAEALPSPETAAGRDQWHRLLAGMEDLSQRFSQAGVFVHCLTAQDIRDTQAKVLQGRLSQLGARYRAVHIALQARARQTGDEAWQALLADERFAPFAFNLRELRDDAREMLPAEQERLMADLAVDGFQAWGRFYQTIVGRVSVEWEADGQVRKLSAGQAYNKFAHPDQAVRARLMQNWEAAWAEQAELCAAALNHVGGFRLTQYRHRGWDSVLARGLKANRVTAATVDAMWAAINASKPQLVAYFKRKAGLMGTDALHWYDEMAPLNRTERSVSYDEAAEFICDHFAKFSPRMAAFAERAFEGRWIEAEDRPGKLAGGWCSRVPLQRQSRIFLTFGGNSRSTSTLAHELGHAFHNEVQFDLPFLAQGHTMCTAETASTFAETIVDQAALLSAGTREERLALLDNRIRRTVAMFMNIHARYLFELRFYEARRHALLSYQQLNELMLQSQQEAFADGLASYHPHFWASKGHFYGTSIPFYNYPYTFGFLFANGVYARATAQGRAFEQQYIDLLRDTGRMTTETLAQRHLGVDLTQPDFWQEAVKLVIADVHEFMRLSDQGATH